MWFLKYLMEGYLQNSDCSPHFIVLIVILIWYENEPPFFDFIYWKEANIGYGSLCLVGKKSIFPKNLRRWLHLGLKPMCFSHMLSPYLSLDSADSIVLLVLFVLACFPVGVFFSSFTYHCIILMYLNSFPTSPYCWYDFIIYFNILHNKINSAWPYHFQIDRFIWKMWSCVLNCIPNIWNILFHSFGDSGIKKIIRGQWYSL